MTDSSNSGLQPLARARLYEQVAEQITAWITSSGLVPGDKLLPERDFATKLGVSRATVSQALVALEVIGVVAVRHGDGAILREPPGTTRIADAMREHAERLPDVFDARDALETKIAALAASRHTAKDLQAIDDALAGMRSDIAAGGRGVDGDAQFHAALTAAAHSGLLARMMSEIGSLIRETRLKSLSDPSLAAESLAAHQRIADAVRKKNPAGARDAMQAHLDAVSQRGDWRE